MHQELLLFPIDESKQPEKAATKYSEARWYCLLDGDLVDYAVLYVLDAFSDGTAVASVPFLGKALTGADTIEAQQNAWAAIDGRFPGYRLRTSIVPAYSSETRPIRKAVPIGQIAMPVNVGI